MSVWSLLLMHSYENDDVLDDDFYTLSSQNRMSEYIPESNISYSSNITGINNNISRSTSYSGLQISKSSAKNASYWSTKITDFTPVVTNPMCYTIDDFLNAGKEKYNRQTIDPQALKNATELIHKLNDLGKLIDYHLGLSSGYRSPERQRQIYAEKGEKPAMGSKHLYGHALDIADPNGELKEKILNTAVLAKAKELGLYFENFGMTPTWVHIQDQKPGVVGRQIWSADTLLQRV